MTRFSNRVFAILLALALLTVPVAAHAAPAQDTGAPAWTADLLSFLDSVGSWLQGAWGDSTELPAVDNGTVDPMATTPITTTTSLSTAGSSDDSEGDTTGNFDPNG